MDNLSEKYGNLILPQPGSNMVMIVDNAVNTVTHQISSIFESNINGLFDKYPRATVHNFSITQEIYSGRKSLYFNGSLFLSVRPKYHL